MTMRPDAMERWGVVAILKESARLLHKHFRLFMPFILAFAHPASSLTAFQTVFLVPPTHPYMSFVKAGASYTSTDQEQAETGPTDRQPSLILSYIFALLVLIFSNLASAAFTYIVAYIYSANAVDTGSDDDSITKKVFNLLPHAFLRVFVTQLWIYVVLILLTIICFSFAFILSTIVSAIIGGQLGPYLVLLLFGVVPYAIGVIAITIKFALAIPIAVLEPEKYGRAALKQSSTYAKGRTATIFCVIVLSIGIGVIFFGLLQAAKYAKVPPLVEISVTILVANLNSVVTAYGGIVGVVMYFVCKSNFEAVLPAFQRGCIISAAELPYELIGHGSTQP